MPGARSEKLAAQRSFQSFRSALHRPIECTAFIRHVDYEYAEARAETLPSIDGA